MNKREAHIDKYEQYEDVFSPLRTDRRARRGRKPKARHMPKKAQGAVIAGLVDETAELEGDFKTTYQPSRYEEGWLLSSLRPFYEQAFITDVAALVKGGKEASVYRCEAHPSAEVAWYAAKVYRPHMFRQLRNDAKYREGREVFTVDGQLVLKTDHRTMRALGKKTAYGVQVAHTSWLMHEYKTLQRLYEVGAAVPQPVAAAENAILMGYVGDEQMAAPTLHEVDLEPGEAAPLFREVLRNIELMLQHDLIHGDLSAYNVLYWDGEITLIDFPQVVNSVTNGSAYAILGRDIARICEYFARQGVDRDPAAVLEELWYRYVGLTPDDPAAGF